MAAQVDCTRDVLGSHPDAEMHLRHLHHTFSQQRAVEISARLLTRVKSVCSGPLQTRKGASSYIAER